MAKLEGGMYYPGVTTPGPNSDYWDDPYQYSPPEEDDPYGLYGPPSIPMPQPWPPVIPGTGPVSPDMPYRPAPAIPGPIPPGVLPPANFDPPYEGGPIQSASIVTGAASLALIVGPMLARFLWPMIRTVARAAGGVVRWGALPPWLQRVLIGAGIVIGTDFALDEFDVGPEQPGGGLTPFIPGPGEDFGSMGTTAEGQQVVKVWVANGTPFVKLANGRLGAMKRDGSWKFWTPKKPTVIYGTGAVKLSDLLKADKVVHRQIGKLKKVISRRYPKRASASKEHHHHHKA